jgi:hypothetical protein
MGFRAGQKIRLFIYPGAEITVTEFYCDSRGTPIFAFVHGKAVPIDNLSSDPEFAGAQRYAVTSDLTDAIGARDAWLVPEESR